MSEEKTERTEREQTEELALRVANVVSGRPVAERIAQVHMNIMEDIKREILQKALESLLLYRGQVSKHRDEEWSRTMSVVWLLHKDAHVPTDPYELQKMILGWQQDRERQLGQAKYNDGLESGWRAGMDAGTRLGFGGASMGKDLDEVLVAARNKRPSL